MSKYHYRFAIVLAAIVSTTGCDTASAGVPAYQIYSLNLRHAPIIEVDESQEQNDIAFIAAWIPRAKASHPGSLRGDVAKVAGLSDGRDVNWTGVSFLGKDSNALEYFFCLFTGRSEKLIARKNDKFIVYWVIGGDNRLRTTIYIDNSRLLSVPNDQYRAFYDKLIAMFLDLAKQETPGGEPSGEAPKN